MLRLVDNPRRQQLAWLSTIIEQTGWNWSELARRSGLVPQTFSKFRHDPKNSAVLDTVTVSKIAAVVPVPHYENKRGLMPEGFDENEASPFVPDGPDDMVERAIAAMRGGSNALDAWQLNTDALENAGYRRGDVLIVDYGAVAKPGDVVCAQIYDDAGGAETAFRILHRPFLVAASNQLRFMSPRLINDQVDIRGVVVASVRPRLSRLAS